VSGGRLTCGAFTRSLEVALALGRHVERTAQAYALIQRSDVGMSLRTDAPPRAAADLGLADDLFTAVGQLRRHGRRLGGGPFPAGTLSGDQVELVRLVRRQLAEAEVLTRVTDPQDRRVARLALTAPAHAPVNRPAVRSVRGRIRCGCQWVPVMTVELLDVVVHTSLSSQRSPQRPSPCT